MIWSIYHSTITVLVFDLISPRPKSKRFAFDKDEGIPTRFSQIISSCPAIPQLAGAPPPPHPNPPSGDIDDAQQRALWLRKAEVFVEFYSLLFLPFTKTWGPLDPTQPELEIHHGTIFGNFSDLLILTPTI
jgi:hypothetical protein